MKWTVPITTVLFPAVFVCSCLEISYITTSKELHAKHFVTNNIKTVHMENTESQTAASHYGFSTGLLLKMIKCVKEKQIFAAHADCDGRAKPPPPLV